MAPYPTTVRGLRDQLRNVGPDIPAYVQSLRSFALSLGTPTAHPHVMRGQRRVTWTYPSPAHAAAHRLVGELVEQLRAAPAVLGACERLVEAGPVLPADRSLAALATVLGVPAGRVNEFGYPVYLDGGTGEVVVDDGTLELAAWWPKVPPAVVEAGGTAADLAPEGFLLRPGLPAYADVVDQVAARAAGYDAVTRRMRGGNGAGRRAARQGMRAITNSYRDHAAFLAPFGDLLAARYAASVAHLTGALDALTLMEGLPAMPSLTSTPAVVSTLATRIRDAITTGHGGRLVVSDSEQAFAWAPGVATSLLSYLAQSTVTGRRTTIVTARDGAAVVGPVAEAGPKPANIVDFDSADVDLVKYPGQATITVEASQFVQNIEAAVSQVITGQIVRAVEADAVTAILADAGEAVTGAADMTAGVLSAIAALRSNGAAPNVVALHPNDWVAIMTATGSSGYLNFSDPAAGPAGTWLGLAPVIVGTLSAGTSVVLDGRSVSVQEPAGGPLCIVDPFTQANINKIVVTIEAWAKAAVVSPGGAATVTVTTTP